MKDRGRQARFRAKTTNQIQSSHLQNSLGQPAHLDSESVDKISQDETRWFLSLRLTASFLYSPPHHYTFKICRRWKSLASRMADESRR